MTTLHLDIESFSECDLKSTGAYRYAEHPSTEILVACYAFDDEEVQTWVPGRDGPVPERLRQHIESGGEVRAHNAAFERVVLNGVAGKKIGFPRISVEQTICTALKAASCGLPRNLSDACAEAGTHPKDDAGRIVMLRLTKPRRPTKKAPATRFMRDTDPGDFAVLDAYCADDVRAERGLDKVLPDLPPDEQEMYIIDQLMNERGWQVDLEAIGDILTVCEEYKCFLEAACAKATAREHSDDCAAGLGGQCDCGHFEPLKPTQREKIAEWIRLNGYAGLVDMQAETVKGLLKSPGVPENVKHVLRIYSTYNAKAISKYDAILSAVCADGRLRGMFIMNGANTGRWSSQIVQLQNLFRPVIDDPETAVEAFRARSLEWIRALYAQDPIKVAASCVRSVLIAASGKELMFADYAGVESRGNAWLWGEEWKLQAFRAYDAGTGPDQYTVAYGNCFNVDPRSISKKDPRRQLGKVIDLFGGYEGGVGAFVTMAATYGVNLNEMTEQVYHLLPDDILESAEWMWGKFGSSSGLTQRVYMACDGVKQLWRRGHPRIVQGWKDLKEAAELAVQHEGQVYKVADGKLLFKVVEYRGLKWLCMRLPSGRKLWYYAPRWIPPKQLKHELFDGVVEENIPGEMRYCGTDTYTRQYTDLSTYGGKLCENAVQGLCADILRHAKRGFTRRGYHLIGSVHDEPVTEIPVGFGSDEEIRSLMCDGISWAPGLPLAVEINRARRFKK